MRRALLLIVGVLAVLAARWPVSSPDVDPQLSRIGGPLRPERSGLAPLEAPVASTLASRVATTPGPGPVTVPVAASEAEAAAESVQPSFRLDLRLVAEADGEPLPFWRVAVCEPRHRYRPKEHRNARSDGSGQVSVQGLPHSGPWEVVVYDAAERASGHGEDMQSRMSLRALERQDVALQNVAVRTGPSVVFKGALPVGVGAEDLIVELQWGQSPLSSSVSVPLFARAIRAADGTVRARLPWPGGLPSDRGHLRVFTRDRAWACTRVIERAEARTGEINFEVPFEPLGRLRVDVIPRDVVESEPHFWSHFRSALTMVPTLSSRDAAPAFDPSLLYVDGPFPLKPEVVHLSDGVFEIRGLGVAEYELAPERAGLRFSPAPLRMVATQGVPPVVVIHVDDAR